jgi:hypothetical protein
VVSLLGDIRLLRSYYYCGQCGQGHVPWDDLLGLSVQKLTPAAAEVVCMAGVQASFAHASETSLRKMCGLYLSESTVERTAENTGQRLADLLAAKLTFGGNEVWAWQRDASGRRCGYISLDATGVPQQGEGGTHADGRMAYVGTLYNPDSEYDEHRRPRHQVRYLAGFYGLSELGLQLRRQAGQIGWDEVEQQIALSDGGSGLEDFLRVHFPLAVRIIDFYHVSEHLTELGKALYAEDESGRQRWTDEQCHRLKHEGGAVVLGQLEAIDVSMRSSFVQEEYRKHLQYFHNHVQRMDYPTYLANGWQIGSGPVESACKTVVSNRLKGGGMRWGEPGSDGVCHLRALFLSQPTQWEAFWRNHPN